MHCKLNEVNNEYTSDKKYFINALMATQYGNKKLNFSHKKISKILENTLCTKNIYRLAIYGTNNCLAEWLQTMLKNTAIKIIFVIDEKNITVQPQQNILAKLYSFFKYSIQGAVQSKNDPVILNIFDRWPQVDAIIVAPYVNYTNIAKLLTKRNAPRTIPITELLD
jgi:hypothetical protein